MKFYVSFSVAALLLAAGSFAVAQTKPFNSSYDEQAPFLTKDGSTLYFTVAGNAQNAGGKRDPGDIWVSSLTATGWSRPEPVTNLNNSGYNAVAGLSADGSKLYLYGHYREDGSAALTRESQSVNEPEQDGLFRKIFICLILLTNLLGQGHG